MKKFFSLAIISLLTLSAFATDYTVEVNPSITSSSLPLFRNSATSVGSISQQIFLAEELTSQGATAGNISALTFYYTAKNNNAAAFTRSVQIWLMELDNSIDSYTIEKVSYDYVSQFFGEVNEQGKKLAGKKVYTGTFATTAVNVDELKTLTIPFDNSFPWDGSSNIVVTIADLTATEVGSDASSNLKFYISETNGSPRFAWTRWMSTSDERAGWINDFSGKYGDKFPYGTSTHNTEAKQAIQRAYIPKTTFTIVTPVPVPTSPSASSITTSSAVLGWTAAAGANSYEVRYGTTSGSLGAATNVGNVTSYSLTGLTEETTYYYQIRTKIGTAYSAWTDEASFTTLAEAAHIHDGITFSKWASTTSMPTSGNYYLANDVTYDFYEGGYLDLAGDLNLCLNGHTVNLGTKSINVTSDHTMTLFDHVGGGKITGLVAGDDGSLTFKGVISVENGGTLVLREGEVENTKPADDSEYKSIAIANGGTLIISGAPVISGNDMDIFLPPTIPAKVITIQSGKPLTNTTPYKVYKSDGVITSGWANMSGADPADYFVSANPDKSIYYNGSEAELISILNLSDNADNSSKISLNNGQVRYVATNRSFTAGMYNTICLPFALSSAQIESVFGAGTDVQELSSSTYDGEYIDMYFSPVSAMAANTPYLINPANDVANAAFNGVTIVDATPATVSTSFVDLIGITSITALTASEDRYLLGANNKLGYLEANGNLKGMRAYFDTHNLGGGAAPAKRLRIAPDQSMPSALDETTSDKQVRKHMENGQLIIIRDGKRYNALGAEL